MRMNMATARISTMGKTMTIDPGLMTLSQWLSPAFPTGGFAYSHGLEAAIRLGHVEDGASLDAWIGDLLRDGSGRTDAIWLHLAHGADPRDVHRLDQTARAFAASQERLREADRQGAAFVRTVTSVWAVDLPPLLLPLAVGRAARLKGIAPTDAAALYLLGFASNLCSAAQRLMPLGQTGAQAVLAGLAPVCHDIALATADATEDDLWSNAFLSEVMAMSHETLQPRLFQS